MKMKIKIKRFLILCLTVLMLINIVGCEKKAVTTKQQTNSPSEPVQQQETDLKVGEITDPIELEKLWQEYIYDSMTTVCNTREFNTASEIDPNNVAIFCWFKYIKEYGKESLPLLSEDSSLRLLPLDTVLEYAQRYFNLTSLDLSKILDGYYDPEKRAFTFNIGDGEHPSYNETNAFGQHLEKVTRNSDGTITIVMVQYTSYNIRRVELTKTITLRQREDGSMYFASGRWDFINNNLVTLTGEYNRFDKITGFDGNMEELTMIGEADGRLLLAYTPYEKGINASIMLVEPDTLIVEKKLKLIDRFKQFDIRLVGDKIVVRLNDKIIITDKNLEKSEEIPLSNVIKEKIEREPKYDKNGNPDVFFGDYDISSDLTKIVYSDETGLKLLNTIDNSEKLLSNTVKITGNKMFDYSYHISPRFVAKDKKVITTMTGYESSMGYTLCDLESGTAKKIDLSSESSSTELIYYDTGLLEVNRYIYDQNKHKTLYLDFMTGDISEIKLENPGETGDIREHSYCYVGQNYAAFVTYKPDNNDIANSMFYIERLNLETLILEPRIISVKAAATHILGVLADGRIVFSYNLNPSENGVCITKLNL